MPSRAQNPSLEQPRAIQEHEITKVADFRRSFDTASRIWKGRGWFLTGTNDEMERYNEFNYAGWTLRWARVHIYKVRYPLRPRRLYSADAELFDLKM